MQNVQQKRVEKRVDTVTGDCTLSLTHVPHPYALHNSLVPAVNSRRDGDDDGHVEGVVEEGKRDARERENKHRDAQNGLVHSKARQLFLITSYLLADSERQVYFGRRWGKVIIIDGTLPAAIDVDGGSRMLSMFENLTHLFISLVH